MKYDISIQVTFPENIAHILRQEKQRYVADFGSHYRSEPHITLYVDSYTPEGYPNILKELQELRVNPFIISLCEPVIRVEPHRHRNLYIMDVSNKEPLHELHRLISELAIPYRSPMLRVSAYNELTRRGVPTDGTRKSVQELHIPDEPFDPHITLGEIDFDQPQADIVESRRNLESLIGSEIRVSSLTVFWYGTDDTAEKASLLEQRIIPLQ